MSSRSNESKEAHARRLRYQSWKISNYRRENKLHAIKYKGGKCEICGYNKSAKAMHFHHPDPTLKDFNISHGSYSWAKIKAEVEKCQLLCMNCHAEIHEKWDQEIVDLRKNTEGARIEAWNKRLDNSRAKRYLETEAKQVRKQIRKQVELDTWMSSDELKELVWQKPIRDIAKSIGVSDTAVRQRCVRLGILTPGLGYWNKIYAQK